MKKTFVQNPLLSPSFQILFIVFVALSIYYPSLWNEPNGVDDALLLKELFSAEHFNIKNLFFPLSPLHYYRPMLMLTFHLDKFLFDFSEISMHFHNVLLHAANGVLVFLILKEMRERRELEFSAYGPLLASLLFILHPVNTEPVNWISGRTDILAGFFVLLSFYLFLKKGISHPGWCGLSALVYLLGALSKEVAVGYVIFMVFYIVFITREVKGNHYTRALKLFLPFLFATVVYFLMRKVASASTDQGITTTIKVVENRSLFLTAGGIFSAIGFYFKKMIIPVPLNFAITGINKAVYSWVGVAVAIILFILYRRRKYHLLLLMLFSFAFILPALPIALSKISWTPFAERYLYISSVGISAIIISSVQTISFAPAAKTRGGIAVALILLCALLTIDRNKVWQSNLALYADTAMKSPDFAAARNQYGIALYGAGRIGEAQREFEVAKMLGKDQFNNPELNLIALKKQRKAPWSEIRRDYGHVLQALQGDEKRRHEGYILHKLISALEMELAEEKNTDKRKRLYKEQIQYLEQILTVENSGFYYYKLGQYYLLLDNRNSAVKNLEKSIQLEPDAFFSKPAAKLIEKIKDKSTMAQEVRNG